MQDRKEDTASLSRRFHIITMGCQMNQYDSDLASQILLGMGYLPAENETNADLILINTCAVRARAEQKAFSILGRMIKQKKRAGGLKVGIMGCVAQLYGPDLFTWVPDLDFVIGTREVEKIKEHVRATEACSKKMISTGIKIHPPRAPHVSGYFRGRVTAYISIMEGCDNFCTYCIVPFTRGREVSRSPEEIKEEVMHLISEGVREITLLGQNVNSYSFGETNTFGFSSLLRNLSPLKDLLRLRFTTSHPKDLSDDLIRCFKELPNLCPHIHLPFQSGSNRILRRMNRGYTREHYIRRVAELRQAVPGIAITSDVMVGFPGESLTDFENTLDLMKKIEFDNLYSFKYSDRDGTKASLLSDKIDDREKTRRLLILQDMQKEITFRKNREIVGSERKVLVEGFSRRGHQLTGKTPENKIVNFKGDYSSIGNIVQVLINASSANSLRGEYISATAGALS